MPRLLQNRHYQTAARRAVRLFLMLAALAPGWLLAQSPLRTDTPTPSPSIEDIDAQLEAISGSTELDEAVKAKLAEMYQQAKSQLAKSSEAEAQRAQYEAAVASTAADTAQAKQNLERPLPEIAPREKGDEDLNVLVQRLSELERQREAARQELAAAKAEPQRRAARKVEIPQLLAAAREKLQEVENQAITAGQTVEPENVQTARSVLLQARRQAAISEIAALEQELALYDTQSDLPRLRSDQLARVTGQLDEATKQLAEVINSRRRRDAASQARQADLIIERTTAALRPAAEQAALDARRRQEIAKQMVTATKAAEGIDVEIKTWDDEYRLMQNRVEKGTSETLGLLLRRKRSALPELRPRRDRVAENQEEMRSIQAELFELEDRRSELSEKASAARAAEQAVGGQRAAVPPTSEFQADETQADGLLSAAALLQFEVEVLDGLIADMNRYLDLLVRATSREEELISLLAAYRDFLDARIFWIRSAAVLQSSDLRPAGSAAMWLLRPAGWFAAGRALVGEWNANWWLPIVQTLLIIGLFSSRLFLWRKIGELGQATVRGSSREFLPTLRVLAMSAAVAAPWPLLTWYLSRRLDRSADEFSRALGTSLGSIVLWFFCLELVRQICRSGGLAEAHFLWSSRVVALLRTNVRLLILAGLPLKLVAGLLAAQENEIFDSSLGRICFVLMMVVGAVVNWRLLHPLRGIPAEEIARHRGGWLDRLRYLWFPALLALPLALAGLALAGYYFTAWKLSARLEASTIWLVALLIIGALLYRWVLVKRRRLRVQQMLEYRSQQQARSGDDESIAALLADEEGADLSALDLQTRRLIRIGLGLIALIGLQLTWTEVLPALGMLDGVGLWTVDGSDGAIQIVTLANLLLSLLTLAVTVLAARNIPGVIEIALLERLPLESSIRYAITTISQYVIVLVGLLAAFGMLGASWSKVQWLVAALGVGLGFGLQEIFANFVSGLILLFERPVRVGDIITLGDSTGMVTKIRIRATTIRNWDLQELIVPNKDLITGRLLNWTLSDNTSRISFPVGVAYGTDTRRARDVLLEILKGHSGVLGEPTPMVTFEAFGDSTLNLIIRAYIASLDNRLEIIHELHTQIHERFAAEEIEIAFPQRDLHIRTVQQPIARDLYTDGADGESK